MFTSNEKKQLKALASVEKTKYQIGKNEISDNLLDMLNKALTARELIKIDAVIDNNKLLVFTNLVF